MRARSMPRPSSVIVMATLARSRTAASTMVPSTGFLAPQVAGNVPRLGGLDAARLAPLLGGRRIDRVPRPRLDVARAPQRLLDVRGRRLARQAEGEAAVEVVGLEARERRGHAMHRPQ